jgi:hypothetical protein
MAGANRLLSNGSVIFILRNIGRILYVLYSCILLRGYTTNFTYTDLTIGR